MILPCLAGKASSKTSILRRMWKYQREFKGGPEKRPRAGKGVVSPALRHLSSSAYCREALKTAAAFHVIASPLAAGAKILLLAINYQKLVTPSIWMMNYTHTPSMTGSNPLGAGTSPSWAGALALLLPPA